MRPLLAQTQSMLYPTVDSQSAAVRWFRPHAVQKLPG